MSKDPKYWDKQGEKRDAEKMGRDVARLIIYLLALGIGVGLGVRVCFWIIAW